MITADFLIDDADVVATCAGPGPRRGAAQAEAGLVARASVAAFEGRVVFVGSARDCEHRVELPPNATIIDARGKSVVPGLVDPHTHVIFAGDRHDELQQRLAGASYAEIAAQGGGILKTVSSTRAASEDELVALAGPRLLAMLEQGTTTVEIKSGYGLELDTELRMLRAIRRLATEQATTLTATFMGAHEFPPEARGTEETRKAFLDQVIEVMIPAVAAEGLAEWCDVFCEQGVFTPEQSARVLRAGIAHGLKPRIHADELSMSGGVAVAVEVGARSADHLIHVDQPHAMRMAEAGVIATLLPAAAFFLKLGRFAPARMLIAEGVPVALATDLNPGGGFSPSMPFVMALACFSMGMTLEEALVAATLNAAAAIDRQQDYGSLEFGKAMDAVLIDGPLSNLVAVGAPTIAGVIKHGRMVA